MGATKGTSEYKVSPALVADRDREGPEGYYVPDLMGAGSEGGIGDPPGL